jgi:sporulation protein YlmC with PRC-barrel domain
MSGIRTATAMALALGIGVAVPALAEGQKHNQGQTMAPGSAPSPTTSGSAPAADTGAWYHKLSADDLVGKDVTNANGDRVAEIDDVVMDPQSRRIHAILAVGGFLGMGEKQVAVPMSEISMGDDNALIISLITEDELKNRPAYVEGQFQTIDGSQSLVEVPN